MIIHPTECFVHPQNVLDENILSKTANFDWGQLKSAKENVSGGI
jgi:hypothetical protein